MIFVKVFGTLYQLILEPPVYIPAISPVEYVNKAPIPMSVRSKMYGSVNSSNEIILSNTFSPIVVISSPMITYLIWLNSAKASEYTYLHEAGVTSSYKLSLLNFITLLQFLNAQLPIDVTSFDK